MDKKVQIVTDGLREMIQPYLGKREYSCLRISSKFPNWMRTIENEIFCFLLYERILGSTSQISVDFLLNENVFQYFRHPDEEEIRTEDPQIILNHFKQRLDYIPIQRREDLIDDARQKKKKETPLEKAVAEMRKFAQEVKSFGRGFGPTEDKLKLYEQFCNKVYSI